ncbi:hypothetical protein [Mangrovitalea sediminis]|uniref:hypothetical protein n=1 Tax=Mangrovitalea sediminis TaxID=1982043 RepID=UPI000BE5AE15|nr:hypothetical protein [Mangrovitalea sediminis]
MDDHYRHPINWYRKRFATLQPVSEASAVGTYLAVFVGPWWLRVGARWSLPLSGMRGWVGKRIEGNGRAVNLVRRAGQLQDFCPMQADQGPSLMDDGQSLIFSYAGNAPGMLRFFRDELRQYDEHRILAFARVNLPLLNLIPLPFMLKKAAEND